MNFIESIFESIKEGLKIITGERPNYIENYCIGSGSNFVIHKNISIEKAEKIYKEMTKKLPLGKKAETKKIGNTIMEKWNCLESQTGYTYTFMFKIEKIIEHDPNNVIEEWQKYKEKVEETKRNITEIKTK